MDARSLVPAKPVEAIEPFRPGDTVVVNVKIKEGDRERVQAFQGNVIIGGYRKGDQPAPGAMFTVRRVSYGVGVERIFPICSPLIDSVKVVRKGKVRRARLLYLRGLTGRAARIKERRAALGAAEAAVVEPAAQPVADAAVAAVPAPSAPAPADAQLAEAQAPAAEPAVAAAAPAQPTGQQPAS